MTLTDSEIAALDALCDTFVPSLAASGSDNPVLFNTSARELGTRARVAESLGRVEPAKRRRFRIFLALLENPLFMLTLTRRMSRFSRLAHADRERLLQRLARSRVPQLRTAFQGARSLAMFHTYAANGSEESEKVLRAIGYAPEINVEATAPRIPVAKADAGNRIECDVCVIGAGAAGCVVAAELAAAGRNVVVVEAGPDWSASDFDQNELVGMRELFRKGGLSGTRDLRMSLIAGSCIGGGTTVNWQSCFRTPDEVRDEWAEVSGCGHFTDASFTASLDAVWDRIGASADESEINENNAVIRRGAEALGYRWGVIARNARGCDLTQCGNCMFGCRVGGKQSAATTYLSDAIRSGARVIAPFSARRLKHGRGRVSGIEGISRDADGKERPINIITRRVVLAAGALETPALLMRSGFKSAHLGRNLYLHPTVAVTGSYPAVVEAWRGPPQTIVCDEFSNIMDGYGYRIEAVPAHAGLFSVGLPWIDARNHRREMQRMAFAAPSIVLTRDSNPGRVRITRGGDPYFYYRLGKQERHLLKHGMATAARIHFAAGADRILTLHASPLLWERATEGSSIEEFCGRIDAAPTSPNRLPLFSAHQMGTCRMGTDPSSAVCDENGGVFGLEGAYVADASLFPASSGVNPMVTIMALARHVGRAMLQ